MTKMDQQEKSRFSENILNAGHEMWRMEETMTVLYFENDSKKINVFEEMEIMKVTSTSHILTIEKNDYSPLCKILKPLQV